ncbi:MAG: bifunctional histidinol-phosphatase/imidazoleglycerol-phosphate dehydratase HisB [Bacteroidetes bacterium]|nr:bifunctional histidinol-phosphatase/imidazoleglycerol-phosphate dehydratase HisB [Bacteroidota bacterium]MBS1755875.1 bifunctional histidinol-phosphatase/imidazoleglycerol-phosphate dehydratase HisB [Bacteroidota bacterium]
MSNKKAPTKVLFIDRDGTLINEAPPTYQLDSFDKLQFYPHVFEYLTKIATELNYELVMVTNQDGLGTDDFPEEKFWPVQNFVMHSLQNENIHFSNVLIDKTFADQNAATRKPGTGMLTAYLNNSAYDLEHSFVIGDRLTDMQLASNLGCKGIWLNVDESLGADEVGGNIDMLKQKTIVLTTPDWEKIYRYLKLPPRAIVHQRNTNETKINIELNLDGNAVSDIDTGLGFFDHMLDQLSKHSGIDLKIKCQGDLHIDEHHSIEDVAIALGEAFAKALGDKKGIERYGFLLPMDDCLAQVAIDFGGRSWLVWKVKFLRDKIGEMPTEMFYHFFKSFTDAAKCNLNIKAKGKNEHHKIEAIFKAFAKAIRMAVQRDINNDKLPTTKGVL